MDTKEIQFTPLLLGAVVGFGLVYLTDPHRGESRRTSLKARGSGVGTKWQSTWTWVLRSFGRRLTHAAPDFQTEIRQHASTYLQ